MCSQKQRLHSPKYDETHTSHATDTPEHIYMQAYIDNNLIVRFDGTMAELLEIIVPSIYRMYIHVHAGTNRKPVL